MKEQRIFVPAGVSWKVCLFVRGAGREQSSRPVFPLAAVAVLGQASTHGLPAGADFLGNSGLAPLELERTVGRSGLLALALFESPRNPNTRRPVRRASRPRPLAETRLAWGTKCVADVY